MVGKWWVDYAAQSVIHALVAALAIEALLQIWHARAPDDRLALRLLGLGQPLVFTPLLFVLGPSRRGEEFHDRWALFASRRWEELPVLGTTAFHLAVGAAAVLGALLFLMDLVPLLPGRRRELPPAAPAPLELEAALAEVAAARARRRPSRQAVLHFVDAPGPALFCVGVRRPRVVVSRGALALLDGEELRAALAHELAHLRAGDPALSWVVMAARSLLFFNPVAQVVARAVARDAEWRADEAAGCDRLALASALLKLHRAGLRARPPWPRSLPLAAALSEPLRRARSHDVEARCRRLLEPVPPPSLLLRPARLALTAASLAGLSLLVT